MSGLSKSLFKPYSLDLPSSQVYGQAASSDHKPQDAQNCSTIDECFADDFAKAESRTSFESFLTNLSGKESHEILEDGGASGAAVDAFSPYSFDEVEALRGNGPSYFAKKFLEKRTEVNNSEKLREVENAYQAAYKNYLIKDILSHSKPDSPKYEVLSRYAKEELLIGKKSWQFWKMTPEKSARFWTELPLNLVFCFLGGLTSKGVGPRVTSALTKMLGPALSKVLGPSLAKFLAPSLAKTMGFTAETGVFSHSVGIMDGAKNLLLWQDASYFETLRHNPKAWTKADLNSWAMAGGGIAAFKYSGAVYNSGIGSMIPKQRFVNLVGSSIVATPLVTAATGFESKLLGHEPTAEQNSESILSNMVFSLGLGSVELFKPAKVGTAKEIIIPRPVSAPKTSLQYSGLGGLPKSLLEKVEKVEANHFQMGAPVEIHIDGGTDSEILTDGQHLSAPFEISKDMKMMFSFEHEGTKYRIYTEAEEMHYDAEDPASGSVISQKVDIGDRVGPMLLAENGNGAKTFRILYSPPAVPIAYADGNVLKPGDFLANGWGAAVYGGLKFIFLPRFSDPTSGKLSYASVSTNAAFDAAFCTQSITEGERAGPFIVEGGKVRFLPESIPSRPDLKEFQKNPDVQKPFYFKPPGLKELVDIAKPPKKIPFPEKLGLKEADPDHWKLVTNVTELKQLDIVPTTLGKYDLKDLPETEMMFVNLKDDSSANDILEYAEKVGKKNGFLKQSSILDKARKIAKSIQLIYKLKDPSIKGVAKTIGYFKENGGVCRNVSPLVQMAFQKANIPSRIMDGTVNGGPHKWVEADITGDGSYEYVFDLSYRVIAKKDSSVATLVGDLVSVVTTERKGKRIVAIYKANSKVINRVYRLKPEFYHLYGLKE